MRRPITPIAAVAAIISISLLAGCGQERTTTIVHTTTDNGAVIIARENRASSLVAMQVFVRDGALFETPEQAGTADLLRTVMLHETETTEPFELIRTIEDLGGIVSTAGRHDFMQYGVTIPSRNFEEAVVLLEDGLLRAKFDSDHVEFAKVKAIENLEEMTRSPVDRAYRMCLRELMGEHPYGRLYGGTADVIQSLGVEDLERRYRERYVASNMLVAVTGDVDPVVASERVSHALSNMEEGVRAEAAAPPVVWPTESRTVVERTDVRKPCQVIGFPGPSVEGEHSVTMDVLLVILMEGRSSRLNRRLKEELGLVHSIGAGWYTQHHPSPLFVWMELDEENVSAAERATVELMQEMAVEPVSDEELAKAKMQLKVGNLRMVETAEGQAFHDGYWNAIGGEEFASEYLERLSLVTADEIRQAAELYFASGVHLAAVVLPE
jgi:predicted Zn-dependent peptidase